MTTAQEKGREYRRKRKTECFIEYGNGKGAICNGCGYNEIEELSLDHVFNDGAQERWSRAVEQGRDPDSYLARSQGSSFYAYLRRKGYPDKNRYQVLCPTCQMRKRNGKCFLPAAFSVEKRIEIL